MAYMWQLTGTSNEYLSQGKILYYKKSGSWYYGTGSKWLTVNSSNHIIYSTDLKTWSEDTGVNASYLLYIKYNTGSYDYLYYLYNGSVRYMILSGGATYSLFTIPSGVDYYDTFKINTSSSTTAYYLYGFQDNGDGTASLGYVVKTSSTAATWTPVITYSYTTYNPATVYVQLAPTNANIGVSCRDTSSTGMKNFIGYYYMSSESSWSKQSASWTNITELCELEDGSFLRSGTIYGNSLTTVSNTSVPFSAFYDLTYDAVYGPVGSTNVIVTSHANAYFKVNGTTTINTIPTGVTAWRKVLYTDGSYIYALQNLSGVTSVYRLIDAVVTNSTVKYYDGTDFQQCRIKYYDGSDWVACNAKYYDGGQWIQL